MLDELIFRASLEGLAGPSAFLRGEEYFEVGAVGRLRITGDKIAAKVEGTTAYHVELRDENGVLAFDCSCPRAADGYFCKHGVALGLAWLDQSAAERKLGAGSGRKKRRDPWRDINHYLFKQPAETLIELLKPGTAALLVELAEYAVERVEKSMEQVDDSNGAFGDVLSRLGELHLQACTMASPAPEALADRLFALETTLPFGVWSFDVLTYRDVLGRTGLLRYRELAEAQWRKLKPRDANDTFDYTRVTITRIMERLAEASGAIGLHAKAGRYVGTSAHRDIASEPGSWLSPELKRYLIKEFQRPKNEAARTTSLEWNFRRTLAKVNYRIHTDAIKAHSSDAIHAALDEILMEHNRADVLRSYGMRPAEKLLFCGPPGCGKTLAAEMIEHNLSLPLILLRLDSVVSSFLGEIAANLRKVFDHIAGRPVAALGHQGLALSADPPRRRGRVKTLGRLSSLRGEGVILPRRCDGVAGPPRRVGALRSVRVRRASPRWQVVRRGRS